MSPIVQIQRRMMQLGRVRLGEKGPKGEPKKLGTFRFTSASRALLEALAEAHGGTVSAWEGAPDEGYFQVTTAATSLDIILPPVFSDVDGSPTLPYSQWYEMWSAGGCQRRCDGITESLTGKPCMCDPDKRKAGAKTECQITTRVSFMLPDIPGLGVWRLDSKGWNAAVELPLTLEVLSSAAREHKFIPAVLSIQKRTSKQDGQTRRYVVPVIELKDATMRQLASGEVPSLLAINGPTPAPPRPALPSGEPLPVDATFADETNPAFGSPPPLPANPTAAPAEVIVPIKPTVAQIKNLNRLVGSLRDSGKMKTAYVWKAVAFERDVEAGDLVKQLGGVDDEMVLHWTPLRESLTRQEASSLIDRLEGIAAEREKSPFQPPPAVQEQLEAQA